MYGNFLKQPNLWDYYFEITFLFISNLRGVSPLGHEHINILKSSKGNPRKKIILLLRQEYP